METQGREGKQRGLRRKQFCKTFGLGLEATQIVRDFCCLSLQDHGTCDGHRRNNTMPVQSHCCRPCCLVLVLWLSSLVIFLPLTPSDTEVSKKASLLLLLRPRWFPLPASMLLFIRFPLVPLCKCTKCCLLELGSIHCVHYMPELCLTHNRTAQQKGRAAGESLSSHYRINSIFWNSLAVKKLLDM